MMIELRKKSQITIPKEIVNELNLHEGDFLDITVNNGVIEIEPVAVYKKSYVEKLEQSVMRINEDTAKYTAGPFTSVEDAINYLESEEDDTKKETKKKQ